MNVHLLEWLKNTGDGKLIRNKTGVGSGHGDRRSDGSSYASGCFLAMSAMQKVVKQQSDGDAASRDKKAPRAHERPFFRVDLVPMRATGREVPAATVAT
jgi:hypothetical protein